MNEQEFQSALLARLDRMGVLLKEIRDGQKSAPVAQSGGRREERDPEAAEEWITGVVDKAFPKEGNRPYSIIVSGVKLSTYHNTLGTKAVEMLGRRVKAGYVERTNKGYTNMNLCEIEEVGSTTAQPARQEHARAASSEPEPDDLPF